MSAGSVMLLRVGNLYDFFAAVDDDAAAETLDNAPDPARYDVLDAKGIDPGVQVARLEALLCDVEYVQVTADSRHCALVTDPESESRWVVTLTDSLRDALARATADDLARAAVAWSQTEEFQGRGNAVELADFLDRFQRLARGAREKDLHLYCWMSL